MYETRRVIVGSDDQKDSDEYVLAFIRPPVNGRDQKRNWVAYMSDANNGPQISIKKDKGWILVTESSPHGGKIYVCFFKDVAGWTYTTGVVIDFANGWLTQGSSTSRGKVVFDSNSILDLALDQIQD